MLGLRDTMQFASNTDSFSGQPEGVTGVLFEVPLLLHTHVEHTVPMMTNVDA